MRLPKLLPRLSRKQKVLRNLLAVVLLVFLTWTVNDFRAPTANLALRWRAEEYGLPRAGGAVPLGVGGGPAGRGVPGRRVLRHGQRVSI